MVNSKALFQIIFILFISAKTLNATTIKVSSKKGTSVEKLKKAYSEAKDGDIILIDLDILFKNADKQFTIKKNGITFIGKIKPNGNRYSLSKETQQNNLIVVEASFIKFENLSFSNAVNLIRFEAKKQLITNITVKNCVFSNAHYTGIDFRGNFKNILVENTEFNDCKFSLQTMDSVILKDFMVTKCTFKGGDHQISIDNAFADTNLIDHSNIVIDNCKFYVAKRFNIALANTRNATIQNNSRMDGGLQKYSQAIHIEHDTRNVLIKNNTMKNDVGNAIIIFSTGYTGHGNGRKIPDEEKIDFGSSNITLDGNTITHSKQHAIAIGYGKGFLTIKGNNNIKSDEKIISGFATKNTMTLNIDEKALFNGKQFGEITKDEIGDYIKIKS
ncbi:right-handed parallel beta-helix repeat-containing protein [Lutibacter citreus]|uniref:right-handed parallel beta-helix repeat-containing protein n=1 Tax=Lutibacter citreus TaxID=2138210 RepID=UPI000DBE79D4|nr:right-handed parallel beta-helix repeat-containing protein [Lutibacter citreus]